MMHRSYNRKQSENGKPSTSEYRIHFIMRVYLIMNPTNTKSGVAIASVHH